jgi:uridine monophosphate synthetase
MNFIHRLVTAIAQNDSLLCVGLDPQEKFLPPTGDIFTRLSDWGKNIIEQTADLVCCYKPNSAFFEQFGPAGLRALQEIIKGIPEDIPVILDFKRGDIGSTAQAYARAAYMQYNADAVTLNPYLGLDSIAPFLEEPDKYVFLLCQTSNPSAIAIQNYGTPPLYEYIAQLSKTWGTPEQIGLVVGATQPEALQRVRDLCLESWILAPGIGAQGGDLQQALSAGLRSDKLGLIIPVSRSIIGVENPRRAAQLLRDQITNTRLDLDLPPYDPYRNLVDGLFSTGCIKFGSFTLASGKKSPIYLDLRRLVSFPSVLDIVVDAYIDKLIGMEYDYLAGVPYAALPIAAIAASKLRRPMVYPRKELKDHGTAQAVEGVFQPGHSAVILEDVMTSGGSIQTAAETLRSAGLDIHKAVVLVDREQGGKAALKDHGINVSSVLTMQEIIGRLYAQDKLDQTTYLEVRAYLAGENDNA